MSKNWSLLATLSIPISKLSRAASSQLQALETFQLKMLKSPADSQVSRAIVKNKIVKKSIVKVIHQLKQPCTAGRLTGEP